MAHSFWKSDNEQRAMKLFEELLLDGHSWKLTELVDVIVDRLGYRGADDLVLAVFWGQTLPTKRYSLDREMDTLVLRESQVYDRQVEEALFALTSSTLPPELLVETVARQLDEDGDCVWAALMRLKNRGLVEFKTVVVNTPYPWKIWG